MHKCTEELAKAQLPHRDGQRWTCSCGKRYEHVCSTEGCSWYPLRPPKKRGRPRTEVGELAARLGISRQAAWYRLRRRRRKEDGGGCV